MLDLSLIQNHTTLVVAVSGGVDSMVLLHQLQSTKQLHHCQLIVAHVNHQKRANALKEESLVRDYCAQNHLTFESTKILVPKKGNFHDQARTMRYHFFYEVMNSYHASQLLLAHHQDDQAETILMRLIRGSSFDGYRGMAKRRPFHEYEIIRPFLHTTKKEILKYQQIHQVPFLEDESNQSSIYTRNKFRQEVTPILDQVNPTWSSKITNFVYYLEAADEIIQPLFEAFWNASIDFQNTTIRCPMEPFLKQPALIQHLVLSKMVHQISANKHDLSFEKTKQIIHYLHHAKPNIVTSIHKEYQFQKQGQYFQFSLNRPSPRITEVQIPTFGTFQLSESTFVEVHSEPIISDGKKLILWYNEMSDLFPLKVRHREQGDILTFPYGTKKLNRQLIDLKVPSLKRELLHLFVLPNEQIVWIPEIHYYQVQTKKNQAVYLNYYTLKGPSL